MSPASPSFMASVTGRRNYGMSGRGYDPRFLFTWPNSRISVMSGDSAANVLWTVGQDRVLAKLEEPSAEAVAEAEAAFKRPILEKYAHESDPYFATARLWDDGILDPAKNARGAGVGFLSYLECAHGRRPLRNLPYVVNHEDEDRTLSCRRVRSSSSHFHCVKIVSRWNVLTLK
ncbi:MAG: hypothetical protein M5U34_46020 [Chloroflexi bacterium]|nr:hypothetical protein [Chloroflexota bacterium]